jgi:hypothetical protein
MLVRLKLYVLCVLPLTDTKSEGVSTYIYILDILVYYSCCNILPLNNELAISPHGNISLLFSS